MSLGKGSQFEGIFASSFISNLVNCYFSRIKKFSFIDSKSPWVPQINGITFYKARQILLRLLRFGQDFNLGNRGFISISDLGF